MSAFRTLPVAWPAPAHVRALCTLREGGVSTGAFASLNLASNVGDEPQAVAANRARLRTQLGLRREPLWLAQVHGTVVFDADHCVSGEPVTQPEADAALTREHGTVLAVKMADCMPVLLCRRDGTAVAVAHAGWRGLAAGVLEATVAGLGAGADEILAWLGPAIGPAHFEVGDEVRAAFCARDPHAAGAFTRNARERWHCDLYQLATQRLQDLGV